MRQTLLIILLLLATVSEGREYNNIIENISISDGLSNNLVTDITQDGFGYIWIATDNGLNRFDGRRFVVFSEKDRTLKGNSVNTAYYDSPTGSIWVGTKKGIDIIDCATLDKSEIELPSEIREESVVGFAPAGKDGIYILGNYGFIGYFDRVTKKCSVYRESDFTGLIMSMNVAAGDDAGNLIAGQENYGLSIIDLRNKVLRNFMHDSSDSESLPGNNVYAVLLNRDGDFLIGTDHGVCRYDKETSKFFPVTISGIEDEDLSGNIKSIIELSDGTILASAENVLFEDSFGNLWIGTQGNGLEFIPANPPLFRKITSGKQSGGSFCIGGEKIIGSLGCSIVKIDDTETVVKQTLAPHLKNKDAQVVAVGRIGDNLLASVMQEGIFLIASSGKVNRLPLPYENDYANTIFSNETGKVLLGTQHGLYEYTPSGIIRNEKISSAIGYLVPNGIAIDRKGQLWIGTYGNGLFIFDKNDNLISHLTSSNSLASNAVKQLYIDSRQWVWVAGQDGISVIKDINHPEIIKSFNYDSGLPDISIRSITEDHYGNLWLACNNVICRYNRDTDSLETFGGRFKVTETGFIDRASVTAPDGLLYFGAYDGIYTLNPESIYRRNIHVPLRISGYSSYSSTHSPTGNTAMVYNPEEKIKLPRGTQSVTLFLSVPDYSIHGNASYSYRVKNISEEWLPVPESFEITIHNLSPGKYDVSIRADEVFGQLSNGGEINITIVVPPSLWKSWWAILIYVLLAGIAIMLIWRYRKLFLDKLSSSHSEKKTNIDLDKSRNVISDESISNEREAHQKISKVDQEFIDRFKDLILQNIESSNLDMEFIQNELNMSHSTLYRRLKKLTGMSGNELIKKYRLEKGMEMLMKGYSVSETAYACGFSDPGYFSSCFKIEYGIPPSEIKPGQMP